MNVAPDSVAPGSILAKNRVENTAALRQIGLLSILDLWMTYHEQSGDMV